MSGGTLCSGQALIWVCTVGFIGAWRVRLGLPGSKKTQSEIQLPEMMRSLAQTGSDNNLCLGFWEFKVLEESLNQGLRYLTLSVPGWKRGRWWGQKGRWSPGEAWAGNYWYLSCCGLYQCPLWKKKSCFKTCTKTPLLSREIVISFLPPPLLSLVAFWKDQTWTIWPS